jgi:hypothetical protein
MDVLAMMGSCIMGLALLMIALTTISAFVRSDSRRWDVTLYGILILCGLIIIAGWIFKATGLFC